MALFVFSSSLCLILALPLEDSEVIAPNDIYIDGGNSFEHFEYIEDTDDGKDIHDIEDIDVIEDIFDESIVIEVRGADFDPKKCKEQLNKAQSGFKNCMKRGMWKIKNGFKFV